MTERKKQRSGGTQHSNPIELLGGPPREGYTVVADEIIREAAHANVLGSDGYLVLSYLLSRGRAWETSASQITHQYGWGKNRERASKALARLVADRRLVLRPHLRGGRVIRTSYVLHGDGRRLTADEIARASEPVVLPEKGCTETVQGDRRLGVHGNRATTLHGNRAPHLHGNRAPKGNHPRATIPGLQIPIANSSFVGVHDGRKPAGCSVWVVTYVSRVRNPLTARAENLQSPHGGGMAPRQWRARTGTADPHMPLARESRRRALRPLVNTGGPTGAAWGGCARRVAVVTQGAIQPLRHAATTTARQRRWRHAATAGGGQNEAL